MEPKDAVGARIKRIRNKRNMTQVALAKASLVSISMITKIETGKATPSTGVIGALAAALGVPADRISGPQDTPEQLHQLIPTIRRAMLSADLIMSDVEPRSLPELRKQVEQIGRWRRATKYAKIGALLPDLVSELVASAKDQPEPSYALLAMVFRSGNTIAHKLGYPDLSMTAMDRMLWAAELAGDPLLVATTHYLRAAALARIGAGKPALALLDRTMSEIEPLVGTDPDAAAVWTALHMRAGTISATLADGATSAYHLAEAARVAEGVGDRVVLETTVGPANVALHEIAALVDLGHSAKALSVSRAVHLPEDLAAERGAHYHIDTARAYLLARKPNEAIEELYAARALAPEHFRGNATIRAAIETAAEQKRHSSSGLRALAVYAGIPD